MSSFRQSQGCSISSFTSMESKFKVLAFPWLAHGHIFPLLQLSKNLVTRKNFHVYICSTAINLTSVETSIRKDFPENSSIEVVELSMPSLPELPPQYHTTKHLASNMPLALAKALQMSKSSFADLVESLNPDLVIYDLFQPWAAKIASSKGIPSVFFAASGAAAYAFFYHLYEGGTLSNFAFQAIYLHEDERLSLNQSTQTVRDAGEGFAFGNFNLSHDIIVMKSCRGVEGKYIDLLSSYCNKRVIPTGPLIADGKDYDDDEQTTKIIEWLNEKTKCSTVYVSFGSEYFLSSDQIEQVAKGLELCSVDFVWVIRFPIEEKAVSIEQVLPEGFLDRMNKRGLVVSEWAPQTTILAHPSIGGFVSHCGWSSTLESMYFGVPIIGMPMKSEQPINVRVVVEAGVGVEVEKGNDRKYKAEALAKAIERVMLEKEFSENMRIRAKKMSEEMKGTEEGEVSELVEELWKICSKNKTRFNQD